MKKYKITHVRSGNVIASGSSYECVKTMRIASVSSFHTLVSRCKSGKNKKYIVETIESRKGEEIL